MILLDEIAEARSPYGGGAAVALQVAVAAALAEKVRSIAGAEVDLAGLREAAIELAHADARAYAPVREAYALSRGPERTAKLRAAMTSAIEVPKRIDALAATTAERCGRLREHVSRSLAADLDVAESVLRSARESAAVLIAVNEAAS